MLIDVQGSPLQHRRKRKKRLLSFVSSLLKNKWSSCNQLMWKYHDYSFESGVWSDMGTEWQFVSFSVEREIANIGNPWSVLHLYSALLTWYLWLVIDFPLWCLSAGMWTVSIQYTKRVSSFWHNMPNRWREVLTKHPLEVCKQNVGIT